MNIHEHQGQKLVAIDLEPNGSPMVRAVISQGADEAALAESLALKIRAAIAEIFPLHEWGTGRPVSAEVRVLHPVIKSREATKADQDANLASIQQSCSQSAEERERRHESNPNNGKIGWWSVEGIRHSALVRASSATEAISKAEAAEAVGSWEMAEAEWIGEELPEVVSL